MSNPGNDRPSLRLNLSVTAATAASSAAATSKAAAAAVHHTAPPLPKKAKSTYTPSAPIPPPTPTNPAHLQVWHQRTRLSWAFHKNSPQQGAWYGGGETVLYVTDSSPPPAVGTVRQLALHGRGLLDITSVAVETLVPAEHPGNRPSAAWKSCRASCWHADPLSHVLVQPAATYSVETEAGEAAAPLRCQADTQCSRGAVGMTTGLRAASLASHFGEVRLSYNPPPAPAKVAATDSNKDPYEATLQALWYKDLHEGGASAGAALSDDDEGDNGESPDDEGASPGVSPHDTFRQKRLQWVSQRLAQAGSRNLAPTPSTTDNKPTARTTPPSLPLKVSLRFRYRLPGTYQAIQHWGGLHVLTGAGSSGTSLPPHVYTTTGNYGDGQGPRCWLPCLDSAAVVHRASHELVVCTTGPAAAALQCLGAGESVGTSRAVGHEAVSQAGSEAHESRREALEARVGKYHVQFLHDLPVRPSRSHVIPPEEAISWATLQVTHIWSSASWTPIPVRSLAWAIGPFGVVEDPEYFSRILAPEDAEEINDEDETTAPTISREERLAALRASARRKGEGIRQAYFLPQYARAHVYAKQANWSLLGKPTFRLRPLTAAQQADATVWEEAVTRATVGVPHRALSLMRDVLALPTYRTVSYTQIWIPHAVDGGCTSGSLVDCPEVSLNPFLGGCIADARLLPPSTARLPYSMGGGRVLQFLQARAAIRGWIRAALPLGGEDDVGFGYLHSLVEALLISLYERGHGGYGEGGGKGGFFYNRRYAPTSGLNSHQLDFLPIRNIEDMTYVGAGVAAVPIAEERQTDHLWRSTVNGSESHTSALDEFQVRSLIGRDVVEAMERGTDRDKSVPTGSMGWFGSHLSMTYLSSNATSSSLLGCGAVEMMHPISGLVYQSLKASAFRGIVEGRAGIANFVRLVRAAFIAAHLGDLGEKELKLPQRRKKDEPKAKAAAASDKTDADQPKPPFVTCVNEILTKKGLTHTLFTRALQNMCGRLREGFLAGTLVDVERLAEDPRTRQPFVEPEGFPNSYVRGSSTMHCRVGVQVEQSRDTGTSASAKGVQCQIYSEPIVAEGGVAFGGPITIRIVENEGQFREYVKELASDGSRRDWGAMVLHTKPVTLPKAQTQASGTIESNQTTKRGPKGRKSGDDNARTLAASSTGGAFTESNFHKGGYQAIELIRLTNLTPLLWVRVDPLGLYGGRISVFQPDACLAEQLFYDGDAAAQLDAIRALAERPLSIQATMKVTTVFNVKVSELPIRVLADCLRGSPALHSSLPHTPVVRAHAALAMAQWQNNKGPQSKDTITIESWIGLNLLIQYFNERFYSNSVIMPVKFSRIALKRSEAETQAAAAANNESGAGVPKATHDDGFYYYDNLDEGEERADALSEAEDVETEEDEEYRVRSACITAIASVRAKDGQTPSRVIKFLEDVLEAEDASMMGNVVHPDDDMIVENTFRKMKAVSKEKTDEDESEEPDEDYHIPSLPYASSMLVADTLLSLCHVNASPAVYTDPATGSVHQMRGKHPVTKLMELALGWLEWELYRENIRRELNAESCTGISDNCYALVAPCAVMAIASLAILRQSTTEAPPEQEGGESPSEDKLSELTRTAFYVDIFDSRPLKNDLVRAAAAQAFTSLCCASDRLVDESKPSLGLLTALEFLLDRMAKEDTSPSLRHTLSALMMDACTGKVCSMQRVGAIAGRNDLYTGASRFLSGPLGASHGGDNGSAVIMSVSASTHPAASAVNDGARRGLRLINRAGHPRETTPEAVVIRIALFATKVWRTINGEKPDATPTPSLGVCSYDGGLRCSLLTMWQWLWPRGCYAILRVQSWGPKRPVEAENVMTISEEEKAAASAEEATLGDLSRLVDSEIDRQVWRGEMVTKAYTLRTGNTKVDVAAAEQGLGQPLPPIQRDTAFKQGGWIASWAQQRRQGKLDGGTAVTKLRLKVGGGSAK